MVMSYRVEYYETFMGLKHRFIYNKDAVSSLFLRGYVIIKCKDKSAKSGTGIAERSKGHTCAFG